MSLFDDENIAKKQEVFFFCEIISMSGFNFLQSEAPIDKGGSLVVNELL